jgi:hypothetical protein
MKIEGSGSESRSRPISQRYGSADPDPHQNVMDPQHWFFASLKSLKKGVGSGVGSGSEFISQECGSGSTSKCYGSPTLPSALQADGHWGIDKCKVRAPSVKKNCLYIPVVYYPWIGVRLCWAGVCRNG